MDILITEQQYSTMVRRRIDFIEQLVRVCIENMYVCDYDGSDEFIESVYDELRFTYSDYDDLSDISFDDISQYIFDNMEEEIRQFYKDRCLNKD